MVAIASIGSALAQRPPTDAEKALASQINCEDFTRLPDGRWKSGPFAKVGKNVFSNNTFPQGLKVDGVDIAAVVEGKCSGR